MWSLEHYHQVHQKPILINYSKSKKFCTPLQYHLKYEMVRTSMPKIFWLILFTFLSPHITSLSICNTSLSLSIWFSHRPLAIADLTTPCHRVSYRPPRHRNLPPSDLSQLTCSGEFCFLGLFDLGCGFVWFGGCKFVPVLTVGVVATVVVGGRCCDSDGCAVVIVDDDDDRGELIYYFNV